TVIDKSGGASAMFLPSIIERDGFSRTEESAPRAICEVVARAALDNPCVVGEGRSALVLRRADGAGGVAAGRRGGAPLRCRARRPRRPGDRGSRGGKWSTRRGRGRRRSPAARARLAKPTRRVRPGRDRAHAR